MILPFIKQPVLFYHASLFMDKNLNPRPFYKNMEKKSGQPYMNSLIKIKVIFHLVSCRNTPERDLN